MPNLYVLPNCDLILYSMLLAPSLGFTLFYVATYAGVIAWTTVLLGDFSDPGFAEEFPQLPAVALVSIGVFFILQTRELKRFFGQQSAMKKEQQVSNVLNFQSDAIVVVQSERPSSTNGERSGDEEVARQEVSPLSVLFCNSQSIRLFGFDFSKQPPSGEGDHLAQSMLQEPRFESLDRADNREAAVNSAVRTSRAFLGEQARAEQGTMVSLKDIMLRGTSRGEDEVESYVMRSHGLEPEFEDRDTDRAIIVRRLNLEFNGEECRVLNFTDITTYKRLKHEEETRTLLIERYGKYLNFGSKNSHARIVLKN